MQGFLNDLLIQVETCFQQSAYSIRCWGINPRCLATMTTAKVPLNRSPKPRAPLRAAASSRMAIHPGCLSAYESTAVSPAPKSQARISGAGVTFTIRKCLAIAWRAGSSIGPASISATTAWGTTVSSGNSQSKCSYPARARIMKGEALSTHRSATAGLSRDFVGPILERRDPKARQGHQKFAAG